MSELCEHAAIRGDNFVSLGLHAKSAEGACGHAEESPWRQLVLAV